MRALANVLMALVALSHLGFLALEMFLWDHPVGAPRRAARRMTVLPAGRPAT